MEAFVILILVSIVYAIAFIWISDKPVVNSFSPAQGSPEWHKQRKELHVNQLPLNPEHGKMCIYNGQFFIFDKNFDAVGVWRYL